MAGYGLEDSDHCDNKNDLKTSTYEKRAKICSWMIIVWVQLITANFSLDGFGR